MPVLGAGTGCCMLQRGSMVMLKAPLNALLGVRVGSVCWSS